MYQLFRVHLASPTEFEVMRAVAHDDTSGDVLLGKITMQSCAAGKLQYTDDFDQAGVITQEERDSVWMLIDVALDHVDQGQHTAFTFEVDI